MFEYCEYQRSIQSWFAWQKLKFAYIVIGHVLRQKKLESPLKLPVTSLFISALFSAIDEQGDYLVVCKSFESLALKGIGKYYINTLNVRFCTLWGGSLNVALSNFEFCHFKDLKRPLLMVTCEQSLQFNRNTPKLIFFLCVFT